MAETMRRTQNKTQGWHLVVGLVITVSWLSCFVLLQLLVGVNPVVYDHETCQPIQNIFFHCTCGIHNLVSRDLFSEVRLKSISIIYIVII